MFHHGIVFSVMYIFWDNCFDGVIFQTGVMEHQSMGG